MSFPRREQGFHLASLSSWTHECSERSSINLNKGRNISDDLEVDTDTSQIRNEPMEREYKPKNRMHFPLKERLSLQDKTSAIVQPH